MSTDPIYLDHNATTPIAREVADAMWPFLTDNFGNPSSQTAQGVRARHAVGRARTQMADLIGANPDEIIFTSGGTESNNLAIRGAAAHAATRVAVTSAVEHPATVAPLDHLRDNHGWRVTQLPVDHEARILMDDWPSDWIGLGTLILAHNEVGTVQPMRECAEAVHDAGGLVHADAAQAIGKIAVSVDALGVDLLSIAGHKTHAPRILARSMYAAAPRSLRCFVAPARKEVSDPARRMSPGSSASAQRPNLPAACSMPKHDAKVNSENACGTATSPTLRS